MINEIHLDEDDKTKRTEFIELYNSEALAVDVSGWYFSSGVDFVIPAGTSIEGNDFLVIAWNPTEIESDFGHAGALGPWVGKLSNKGETITLRDQTGTKIDEVSYGMGFPWPTVGDEPSPSIELINPALDNDLGGSWRSSGNAGVSSLPAADYILRNDTQWHYRPGDTYPAADTTGKQWNENGYNENTDGRWLVSQAPFGFGDGDDNTELLDMRATYRSLFLRHEFTIAPGEIPNILTLRALYDDGLAIYINGTEVHRYSLDTGDIPFPPPNGFARSHEAVNYEEVSITGATSYLVEGVNTISVQLINFSISSNDATADIELLHAPSLEVNPPIDPSPGSVNSVFANNAPPAMRQVKHLPEQPTSSDPVTISVKVTDPDGVESVELDYQLVSPGDYIKIDDPRYASSWTTVTMSADGDDLYSVTLPASLQTHRGLVRYRIRSRDSSGANITVPYSDDPSPNFAYFVYDAIPTWTGKATPSDGNVTYDFDTLPELQKKVAVYQLITTRQEHVDAQYIPGTTRGSGYTGSDYLWQGTLVYNGEVYDHIRFRARGGFWRYAMGKNMWKFDFNRGHRFQARDNYGKKYDTVWSKLNFSALIQQKPFGQRGEQGLYESVGFRLFDMAGSEACRTHYVHFRIIEGEDETGPGNSQFDDDFQGLYLAIEQMDGQYLEEHKLPDGNLYKMESGTGTSNNQGPDQVTDKSDLNGFLADYGNTQSTQWWRDNLDLPRYYSYRTIVEGIRHYDIHAGKNYFYFNNPDSNKWEVHSWDLDVAWSDGGFGTGNEPFKNRVLVKPELALEYRNTARSIRDLLLNPEQGNLLIEEQMQFVYEEGTPSFVDADRAMWDYNPILISNRVNAGRAGHGEYYKASVLSPDSYKGMAQKTKDYIAQRSLWIDNNVLTDSAQLPDTPMLTYTGEAGFPSNGITVQSSDFSSQGSSFAAMQFRLAETSNPALATFDPAVPRKYEIETDWETAELTNFTSEVTIPSSEIKPGRNYRARVRHLGSSGHWSHWSEPVEFVASAPDVSEYQANLMITEIMYNPPSPQGDERDVSINNDDFEWIELTNIGETTLDLSEVRFTKGVDFDFPDGTTLAPGAFILVVKNEAAFIARYGAGLPVAGTYGSDNLSNGGEQLKLSLGGGTAIHDFVYDDMSPWPIAADGNGFSLVLDDPTSAPDHTLVANWRPSSSLNGSPALEDAGDSYASWKTANGITSDTEDADGDGLSNLLEFFLNGDPNDAAIAPSPYGIISNFEGEDFLGITFTRRPDTADITHIVESSTTLEGAWDDNTSDFESAVINDDGTITEIWRLQQPLSGQTKHFLRLRVILPQ